MNNPQRPGVEGVRTCDPVTGEWEDSCPRQREQTRFALQITGSFDLCGYRTGELNLIPVLGLVLLVGFVLLIGATTFQ